MTALLLGLEYFIGISYVDDTEVFKDPLISGIVDGLGSPIHQGRKLYAGLISKLRMLMICHMAKPEEVLIVEVKNGSIVRETLKDNDVGVQYKIMKETLIYLAHLGHEDIEQQDHVDK